MIPSVLPAALPADAGGDEPLTQGRSASLVRGGLLIVSALLSVSPGAVAWGQTETLRVDLQLRTGGGLTGLVLDHTEHGLVVVRANTPYVFSWNELEAGCAVGTRRALMALDRGGREHLRAEDHLLLGRFALAQGRNDLAATEFRHAERLDPSCAPLIRAAFNEFRSRATARIPESGPSGRFGSEAPDGCVEESGRAESFETALADLGGATVAPQPSADQRAQVLEAYKTFGAKVQEVLGTDVALVESDHFLIWTDWEPRYRERLAHLCESMYAALSAQFGLDVEDDIFLAKCPVFCWRSKARFLRFARQFDGYGGEEAVGYTRSIERNGHVHIVLVRRGRTEADFDRFACTLVHEGTHAFVHRLYSSRLIPHWVNEGYADLTAERVLGDRCPNGENAALLATQYARYNWPISEFLHGTGPIEVHQYALAHSVVAYLEGLDRERFAGFIRGLKAGEKASAALAANYGGMEIDQLEERWRNAALTADELKARPDAAAGVLPWRTDR
jgi:hypothetical protein